MGDLDGRRVVVTGGAGALGLAVVRELGSRGAECWVPVYGDQVPEELTALAEELEAPLHWRLGIDLSNEDAVEGFYCDAGELWASVQVAGGFSMAAIRDTSADDFERSFRRNALTCFLCCREAVARMPAGGRLVNVASRPAVEPAAGMIAYATSKAAVAALTRSLAEETREERVLVNAVLPSIIDTPANRQAMPSADHESWPTPEQIARTIGFLASPDNQLTSGALIPVYGRA